MIVKVNIEGATAHILSEDKTIDTRVPAQHVIRRMPKDRVAFFNAEIEQASASIELGDRMPDQKW